MPPPSLPMDLSNFPALRTRKALLVIDLQNDFISPGGSLSVTEPKGFIDRTITVAKAFRASGNGDVFWIRSQFESHQPTREAHIITSDVLALPRTLSSRPRPPASDDQDADPEAFLSIGGPDAHEKEAKAKRLCPGSLGSELIPAVASSVDSHCDLVIAKSHYSAFESGQLLTRLRTHFVTELYICGALTNISVYATALDAARHGISLTIIQNCCGYRSLIRHKNAMNSLIQLTGCDVTDSDTVIGFLAPQPSAPGLSGGQPSTSRRAARNPSGSASIPASFHLGSRARPATSAGTSTGSSTGSGSSSSPDAAGLTGSLPVRTRIPEPSDKGGQEEGDKEKENKKEEGEAEEEKEKGSPPKEKVSRNLSRAPSTVDPLPKVTTQSKETQPIQPVVAGSSAHQKTESDDGLPPDDASHQFGQDDSEVKGRIFALLANRRMARTKQPERKTSSPESKHPRPHKEKAAAPEASSPPPPSRTPEDQAYSLPTAKMDPETAPPAATTGRQDADTVVAEEDLEENQENQKNQENQENQEESLADEDSAKLVASEPLCEGDTIVYRNVLPSSLEDSVFDRLSDEVNWLRMSHLGGEVPRLVSVQGDVDDDGNMPVYRHPSDESPPLESFSPTVSKIKARVEKIVGHPLNHVLIQLYRSGHDYISEHSDKTLDIVPGSFVCNVSVGAERTMVFRTKRADKGKNKEHPAQKGGDQEEHTTAAAETAADEKKRQVCRVQLPHNSLCRMGLQTNMRWLHAIRQDKRMDRDKTEAELAYDGGRISLTFRHIGTFLNGTQTLIWGQGAVAKTRDKARPIINGQTDDAVQMLKAFGTENHSTDFAWEKHYGTGFDVLHMHSAPRFFASSDAVANLSIQLLLAEAGLGYAKGSMGNKPTDVQGKEDRKEAEDNSSSSRAPSTLGLTIRFEDNDKDGSVIEGVLAIMLYLDNVHGLSRRGSGARPVTAKAFTRLQKALNFQDRLRNQQMATGTGKASLVSKLKEDLSVWNGYAEASPDLIAGGSAPSLADFAFWPALHELAKMCGGTEAFAAELGRLGLGCLNSYYQTFGVRENVKRVCGSEK